RHVVPVDGQTGAGDVRAAGDAKAAANDLGPIAIAGRGGRPLERLAEPHRGDPQLVDRLRVRWLEIPQPQLQWVDAEIRGELVHLAFEPVARLCRAVAAL